jgi:hypothetical protein
MKIYPLPGQANTYITQQIAEISRQFGSNEILRALADHLHLQNAAENAEKIMKIMKIVYND